MVSERAGPVIEFVTIFVEDVYCRDVISLALGPCAGDLCFFDGVRSLLQLRGGRRCPDRMIVAHRDAPVTHAASRVSDRNFGERLFSLFILERMEPGDCPIELHLGLVVTGDAEVDLSELFRRVMSMLVSLLRTGEVGVTDKGHEKDRG